jgi:RHS repeat-associated protein
MAGRTGTLGGGEYRYGFNGKENDGETGWQDYGLRLYDPEICRFFSVDPLTADYAPLTPYQFAANMPIQAVDLDGAEPAMANIVGGGQGYSVTEPYTLAYRALGTSEVSRVQLSAIEVGGLQSTYAKFKTYPYFFRHEGGFGGFGDVNPIGAKWIYHWENNADLRSAIRTASSRFNIPAAELFVLAMGEGLAGKLVDLKETPTSTINGIGDLGLDTFGQDVGRLESLGLLKPGELTYTLDPWTRREEGDGDGRPLLSANFSTLGDAMLALGASWVMQRQDAMAYLQGQGVMTNKLTSDQVVSITYSFFNSNPSRAKAEENYAKFGLDLEAYGRSQWQDHQLEHSKNLHVKSYKRAASVHYYSILGVK